MQRDEAARFSFLLGIPTILLAGLYELWKLRKAGLDLYGWSLLGFGLVVASISAFAAIWGLMRVLERFSAWPFVIYRFLLGVFLIFGVLFGTLPIEAAMTEARWAAVDAYIVDRLLPADAALDGILATNATAGLPSIDVSRRRASCCICWRDCPAPNAFSKSERSAAIRRSGSPRRFLPTASS